MSEEVAALRALNKHLSKKGDTPESLVARARSYGDAVDFSVIYRLVSNDGFQLPPSSVTLLIHSLGDDITAHQLKSMLAMAETVNPSEASPSGEEKRPHRLLSLTDDCCSNYLRGCGFSLLYRCGVGSLVHGACGIRQRRSSLAPACGWGQDEERGWGHDELLEFFQGRASPHAGGTLLGVVHARDGGFDEVLRRPKQARVRELEEVRARHREALGERQNAVQPAVPQCRRPRSATATDQSSSSGPCEPRWRWRSSWKRALCG